MKNVVVMGSTGSVGIQSLDVISKNKSHKVIGLSCYSNADLLFEQTKEYLPNFVAIEIIDPSHNLFNLCKENNIPIQVFNIKETGALKELILGGKIGTLVSEL